jgi:hypothetical protein
MVDIVGCDGRVIANSSVPAGTSCLSGTTATTVSGMKVSGNELVSEVAAEKIVVVKIPNLTHRNLHPDIACYIVIQTVKLIH